MKLIFCPHCQDIVKLHRQVITCECGKSQGTYLNDLNAVYSGDAIPLGINSSSLADAIRNQPVSGNGERFEAFVVPGQCRTFKRVQCIETNVISKTPRGYLPER